MGIERLNELSDAAIAKAFREHAENCVTPATRWIEERASDYSAALSQTSGVALTERELEWLEYAADHMDDDGEPEDKTCGAVIRELLSRANAAAPAASGGESASPVPYEQHEREILKVIDQRDHRDVVIDRILDTVLGTDRPEWSSAYSFADAINDVADRMVDLDIKAKKNTNPPSAASVSERARAILKSEMGGFGTDTQGRIPLEYALRAIEQALTQQRGEAPAAGGVPFGHYWVWKDGTAQFLLGQSNWALESACESVTPLYTTPQTSADAVRELVAEWRRVAENFHKMGSSISIAEGAVMRNLANELESLLSAASGEKGVG